jgi:hypothetical protein
MKCFCSIVFFAMWTNIAFASAVTVESDEKPKIQLALLLDVSNSMDGLIDQAKAQLWKIVNELAKMEQSNSKADIEIALYTFGDDRLRPEDGYIQQWNSFITDLDLISQNLFSLTTSGGDEFCGWAIEEAVNSLLWTGKMSDLQMIVIAGNETFTQGARNYIKSCDQAIQNNIIVNTIYCGDCPQGTALFWEDAANRGQGKYMCIDQNEKVVHIPTPFDSLINIQNTKLNETYYGYGVQGSKRKAMQLKQDELANEYSSSNIAERAYSKSSHAYSNASWDVLDRYEEEQEVVLELDDELLPQVLKGKTRKEKEAFLNELKLQRTKISEEIKLLSAKRTAFIEAYKAQNSSEENLLDAVMLKLIREQAFEKGFVKVED